MDPFTAAFFDELEKLGVTAISRPKGSRIRAALGKLRGRTPELRTPHKYVGSTGTPQAKMSQSELRSLYKKELAGGPPKAGRTTPGGAPMTDSKADMAASRKARAAM